RPAGVGNRLTTINAMPPRTRPYRLKNESRAPARRLLRTPIAERLAADLDLAMALCSKAFVKRSNGSETYHFKERLGSNIAIFYDEPRRACVRRGAVVPRERPSVVGQLADSPSNADQAARAAGFRTAGLTSLIVASLSELRSTGAARPRWRNRRTLSPLRV